MAIDINLIRASADHAQAEARAREFEKRMVSDTIREELEALQEGDIFGLVRIITRSVTVSSLARGIENQLLGNGTFVPRWIRSIGSQACSSNGSTEYHKENGGSLKDLLDIDAGLGIGTHLADAATAFWGGLGDVIEKRKLRRQLQSVGGEELLAFNLAQSIPEWAEAQPLTGINAHFAVVLNSWLGLSLSIKELEYFGSTYSAADYTAPDYSELEEARTGSQEYQQDETNYNLTIG